MSAWVFFCEYATYLQYRVERLFSENTSGELFLYIVIWRTASVGRFKYKGYKYRDSLETGKKLFEIHFSIINTFSNFYVTLAW